MLSTLEKYLPANTSKYIFRHITENNIVFQIKDPRKTKLGDFKVRNGKAIITINNDLNQYAFLITTLHEIAHFYTWKNYGFKVKPHGKEWQVYFKKLYIPIHENKILPTEVNHEIIQYLSNSVRASSCTDMRLYSFLKSHDNKTSTLLKDLPFNTPFKLNNRIFTKTEKLRTYYKCSDQKGNLYRIHSFAEVEQL